MRNAVVSLVVVLVLTVGLLIVSRALPPADAAQAQTAQCVPPQPMAVTPGMPPNATYLSDGRAPERFRADRTITIQFESPEAVNRICSNGRPICGYQFMACFIPGPLGRRIIMPNPNSYPDDDPYAHLLAHELAHVNGWPGWHGE